MRAAAKALTPPVLVPEFDLSYWNDDPGVVAMWLNRHNQVHQILRQPGAVAGIDLSAVDLSDDGEWEQWQSDHADEHQLLRQFFGIV